MKIFLLERKFKNGKLDAFAILILTFALPFCLIGLVVSWKEFLNFCVYFLISDHFCPVLFLFLFLKRTGLSKSSMRDKLSLHDDVDVLQRKAEFTFFD